MEIISFQSVKIYVLAVRRESQRFNFESCRFAYNVSETFPIIIVTNGLKRQHLNCMKRVKISKEDPHRQFCFS